MSDVETPQTTKPLTLSELAEVAGVTDEIMLHRIAGVLQRRSWHARLIQRFRWWWARS